MNNVNPRVRELCLGALFCALTAICSQLVVNIGPVPITLSLLAVYLCGALLPPRTALLAQCAYLLLGLVGVPVFSNFGAGPGKLFGPTGGYLITFSLMAWLVALAVRKWGAKWWVMAASMLVGLLLCYTVGTAWLCYLNHLSLAKGIRGAVLPFIWLDLAKIAVSCALALALRSRMKFAGRT